MKSFVKRKHTRNLAVILSFAILTAFIGIIGVHTIKVGAEPAPASEVKERTSLDEYTFTPEQMDELSNYMGTETVAEVSKDLGSATPKEYVKAFLERDSSLAIVLEEKYNIKVQE